MQTTFLDRIGESAPAGQRRLLARLRRGQDWLTRAWLEIQDSTREDPAATARFTSAMDAWVGLERIARNVYGIEGCVIGPGGCQGDAPARCQACAADSRSSGTRR